MHRARQFVLLGSIGAALALAASASPAAAPRPALVMAGNGGVCSLSSHQTFRMKLSGWKPVSQVQLKIYYQDGSDYPYALRDHGVVTVKGDGSYLGNQWPCWPNQTYDVADKRTTYVVFAFQLGSKPLRFAAATFRVVK